MNIKLMESALSVTDYVNLRSAVGWGGTGYSLAQKSLDNSLFNVIAREGDKTIGLFSALGKEPFYLKYGFVKRDGASLGLGMCKFT